MSVLKTLAVGAVLIGAASANAELIYALTSTNNLLSFNSAAPGNPLSSVGIAGLDSGESLLGIDFRPVNNLLYALGSGNNLYTINLASGLATKVNSSPFAISLSGTSFGFDFNPTVDRIRVVSDSNQNFRLNPNTGAVVDGDTVTPGIQGDGDLKYNAGDPFFGGNPDIVGAGYTNSLAGALTTQLYGLNAANDTLVLQNPPNAGGLTTVGSLGVDVGQFTGFDISGYTNIAYASIDGSLYKINLGTGAASLIGAFGTTELITGIAVIPAPGALALLAVAGLAPRRRRA